VSLRRFLSRLLSLRAPPTPLCVVAAPLDGARLVTPEVSPAQAFLLSVDDAGAFLVALGDELVLGHARGDADLPFLADVAARHARLVRTTTFAAGPRWTVEPFPGEVLRVGGRPAAGRVELSAGEEVELAHNLAFRFTLPDPASATARIELLCGAECLGATQVLLLAEGAGGRLGIGAGAQRHVRVPQPGVELELVRSGERLLLASAAEIRGAEAGEGGLSLPCPPPRRFVISLAPQAARLTPFSLALEPVEARHAPGAGRLLGGMRPSR
jgi:hypothetical protein